VFQRPYVKGRDLYDLLWYLSRPEHVAPNLEYLHHALIQQGWNGPALTEKTWRSALADRLKTLSWSRVREDVSRFLEQPEEGNLLTKENLLQFLSISC